MKSDGSSSDKDFVTDSEISDDSEDSHSVNLRIQEVGRAKSPLCPGKPKRVLQRTSCIVQGASKSDFVLEQPCSNQTPSASTTSTTSATQQSSTCTLKNYCFVCKKPQSKISCHFQKHENSKALQHLLKFCTTVLYSCTVLNHLVFFVY